MISTLMLVSGVVLAAPAPMVPTDAEILYEAKNNCRSAKPEKVDMKLLAKLLKIEKQYGVPDSLRGMLLASACQESGYNPNAEGDHKFSKKRKPKAIGLFQMWPWWASKRWGYGLDRRDPDTTAHAYLDHITKQLPKVRRKCKISKRRVKTNWIVAWVTGIRGYKKEGRCNERPNHLRTLRKWHRAIKKKRRKLAN